MKMMTLNSDKAMVKKIRYFFLIALLLHLLLLLSFSMRFSFWNLDKLYQPYDPSLQQKAFTVLPAYLYQGTQNAPDQKPSPQQNMIQQQNSQTEEKSEQKKQETSPDGIEKLKQTQPVLQQSSVSHRKPKSELMRKPRESSTAEETSEDPLLKLLYNATARHIVYPRVAQDFRVAGTVKVKFLVYPDGHLANITLLKSSGMGYYDDAVIAAVNAMSPVAGVNQYLSQPKYVVAVIVFG